MENTLNFYSNSLHMSTDFLNAGESEKKKISKLSYWQAVPMETGGTS